jgi:tol-pal system protein YbgF
MINFPEEGIMRLKCGFFAVALIVTISGCANTDVIMQKQMETDARLEQLVQGNKAVNMRLSELSGELSDLEARTKANASELEELKPAIGKLRESVDSIHRQKASETASSSVPRIEVVNQDPSPGGKEANAQNAYMKAFGLFSANNYKGAVEAFGSFIKTYPDSEYAPNAMYWIGECHYTQRNYSQAITVFKRVISLYPKGSKIPDAMLKIGFSYISMNDQARAKTALQTLVDKYPESPAAVKARERLNRN